jgi:hypothetical protein
MNRVSQNDNQNRRNQYYRRYGKEEKACYCHNTYLLLELDHNFGYYSGKSLGLTLRVPKVKNAALL